MGLFCIEDAIGGRSLPPQFLDVEGSGGTGKSAAIQTLQTSAELLLEAPGARRKASRLSPRPVALRSMLRGKRSTARPAFSARMWATAP